MNKDGTPLGGPKQRLYVLVVPGWANENTLQFFKSSTSSVFYQSISQSKTIKNQKLFPYALSKTATFHSYVNDCSVFNTTVDGKQPKLKKQDLIVHYNLANQYASLRHSNTEVTIKRNRRSIKLTNELRAMLTMEDIIQARQVSNAVAY